MQENKDDVVIYSPDKLLSLFSRSRMALWISVAVLVHVVVIGLLSTGYIRDTWIDPNGAKERKERAESMKAAESQKLAAEKAGKAAKPAPALPPAVVVPTNGVAAGVTNAAVPQAAAANSRGGGDGAGTDQQKLDEARGTPVGQRITAVAASNDIPRPSSDLGISIEDTNIR